MIVTDATLRQLGWEKSYKEFEREFEKLKREISKVYSIQIDLQTLKKAHAAPELILELLTHIVWEPSKPWRKEMKRSQSTILSAANTLHLAIGAVTGVSKDLSCYPGYWMAVLNKYASVEELKRQVFVPSKMIRQMKAYEEYARQIARLFGRIVRKQAQLGRMEDLGRLVAYVRHTTGRNFDNELARLLTDAHEVAGIKKQFSAQQIKKFRQRHIPNVAK